MARSSYYYHLKTRSVLGKHDDLKERIKTIYHRHKGRYGYRRITLQMNNEGIVINHKTVFKLMGTLGLRSLIRRKKYRSYRGETGTIAPNLLQRNFTSNQPCKKWATDITEFKVRDKSSICHRSLSSSMERSLVTVYLSHLISNRSQTCWIVL